VKKLEFGSLETWIRIGYVLTCSALFFQVLVALDMGFGNASLAHRIQKLHLQNQQPASAKRS
jgi:hypothetical protein